MTTTESQYEHMLKNGKTNTERSLAGANIIDYQPVVKLFTPDAQCTWLLSEIDPEEQDIAFGLCDLGMGSPELGSVRLSELASVRGPFGLAVERNRSFTATLTLSAYADEAYANGWIRV